MKSDALLICTREEFSLLRFRHRGPGFIQKKKKKLTHLVPTRVNSVSVVAVLHLTASFLWILEKPQPSGQGANLEDWVQFCALTGPAYGLGQVTEAVTNITFNHLRGRWEELPLVSA